jgi:hypothetical protein
MTEEKEENDELGFDIDLGSDNQASVEDEVDNPVVNEDSLNIPEETVNDFDISMNYE